MKSHRYFVAAICFSLIFANSAPVYCQSPQNNPAASSRIQIVKDQVQKIGVGEEVTVIMSSGLEYYGRIDRIEADSFEIDEIDLRQMVSINYADARKVEKGYGKMDSSSGKRQKRSRARWIAYIAAVGVPLGLFILIRAIGRSPKPPGRFPRIP